MKRAGVIIFLVVAGAIGLHGSNPVGTNLVTLPPFVDTAPAEVEEPVAAESSPTNDQDPPATYGPELRSNSNLVHGGLFNSQVKDELAYYQEVIEMARKQRLSKSLTSAEDSLISLLEGKAPEEVKRPALLELAFVEQEKKEWQRAQKLFGEYVRRYPKDPSTPEVLFRQGHLYREMGLSTLALTKFYAVISTCLHLDLKDISYYQKLVLSSQAEIAETYYLEGKLEEAADFYSRLLRLESNELNRPEILSKMIRCHSGLGNHSEVITFANLYLEQFSQLSDAPETRFLLVNALHQLGRKDQALREIMVLLEGQEENALNNPQLWRYWQQKAGNHVANQLYRDGDYLNALTVYQTLAGLNSAAEWQMPVWYQIGLIYENLKQPQKAADIYTRIATRTKELGDAEKTPALEAIIEMAAWRNQYIAWEENARRANQEFQGQVPQSL